MLIQQIDPKHLSYDETSQISNQIHEDLVEHLYKDNVTANITGFFTSLGVFLYFYNHAPLGLLIAWLITFNVVLLFITLLTLAYRKYKHHFSARIWQMSLGCSICVCALLWGITIFFNPDDMIHQYMMFAILFMIAAAYSMGTVGEFYIGILSLSFLLLPITIWCFWKNDSYHILGGSFVVLYYFFLLGMNRRSTEWLKNSLRLKIETSFFTHQANHDLLTDLPNQRLLLRHMDNFISAADRTQSNFVIVCFSINRLEMFNNSLGYQAGDLIIQSLAKRLKSHISEENHQIKNKINRVLTLPRSDSFTILMEPMPEKYLEQEVKKLHSVLELPFHLGKRKAKLTSSIGVSVYPRDGSSSRILLSNAYAAMFLAKQQGGSQIEYYKKEINEKTPWVLELENDLYHALEHNEFLAYYQPIVDLSNGRIVGMEALIRWQHPKLGLLLPKDFINLAVETGLIVPIGEWIMQEACVQTARWQQLGFNISLKVSVNLAGKQIRKGNLLEVVDKVLKKAKLDPHSLDLELTETEILDENLAPLIKELTQSGVTLSIDDFGTGYSGLSYLKYFEVDKIKIDRTFITDVNNNEESATIVSAILAMARELNIKTLAEGVETREELDFVVQRGCHYVQGYYFSKPVSTEAFTRLLKEGKTFTI